MSEIENTTTNEPANKSKSSPSYAAIATIFAVIITCAGAIIVAALNPDLAKLFLIKHHYLPLCQQKLKHSLPLY